MLGSNALKKLSKITNTDCERPSPAASPRKGKRVNLEEDVFRGCKTYGNDIVQLPLNFSALPPIMSK